MNCTFHNGISWQQCGSSMSCKERDFIVISCSKRYLNTIYFVLKHAWERICQPNFYSSSRYFLISWLIFVTEKQYYCRWTTWLFRFWRAWSLRIARFYSIESAWWLNNSTVTLGRGARFRTEASLSLSNSAHCSSSLCALTHVIARDCGHAELSSVCETSSWYRDMWCRY